MPGERTMRLAQMLYEGVDLGTEGRVVTLAGHEPLQVVLGASENVSIAVEGRDYPIPDSARRGRMARLTIHSR